MEKHTKLKAEWKFGIKIAAERGLIAPDFPDLIRLDVSSRWVYVLASYSHNYIIIKDDAELPPLYRIYPMDGIGGNGTSLADFIAAEAENPSTRPSRWVEDHKRLFKKWEHVYSFSPWEPFETQEEAEEER